MAREILLYSPIYNGSASELINSLEESKKEDVTLRVNSGGGDTQAAWGMNAKISEHGNVKIKVDGVAFSAAANLTLYAKNVEALDVSTFMFHRAAFEYGGESPEAQAFLAKVNSDLRAKMESKIDSAKLKAMGKPSVAELFEADGRPMLFLNASEMKQLGIVTKINAIDPTEIKAFNEMFRIAAEHKIDLPKIENSNTMTSAELKEKYPAIYAEIESAGFKKGVESEADRVCAAMVFAHLDLEGVRKIIESGKPMTQTQTAEFALKATSQVTLDKLKSEATKPVEGTEVKGEKENVEVTAFEAGLRAQFGLDKKKAEEKRVTLVTA